MDLELTGEVLFQLASRTPGVTPARNSHVDSLFRTKGVERAESRRSTGREPTREQDDG
jgi:hypothetical protein